jgi:dihydrofolate reductase
MLKIIAVVDIKLGLPNITGQPWLLRADAKHFRGLTLGGAVIMGRKTFETLKQPLRGRRNIVISRGIESKPGVEIYKNPHHAVQKFPDAWIIGGTQIYQQTIGYVEKIYLTHIETDCACVSFFPDFMNEFELENKTEQMAENDLEYYFAIYKRRDRAFLDK